MALSLLCTFVAHITFLHVFFLPPPLIFSLSLSLSLLLSLFLSLSLSLSFSLSLYLCPLFLSVVARHMSSDALYQIFSSWSILLFHTISFHSSYKIHQLFTDYLLRLPSSELLEKHLFRSRANRRLVLVSKPSPKQKWTKWIIHSSSAIFGPTKKNVATDRRCALQLYDMISPDPVGCWSFLAIGQSDRWGSWENAWRSSKSHGLSPFFPMFFYGYSKVRLRGLGLAARLGSSGGVPKTARFLRGKMVNKRENHGETWGKSWGKWGSWIDMAVLFFFAW